QLPGQVGGGEGVELLLPGQGGELGGEPAFQRLLVPRQVGQQLAAVVVGVGRRQQQPRQGPALVQQLLGQLLGVAVLGARQGQQPAGHPPGGGGLAPPQ